MISLSLLVVLEAYSPPHKLFSLLLSSVTMLYVLYQVPTDKITSDLISNSYLLLCISEPDVDVKYSEHRLLTFCF